jgi:hypothetical protein
MKNKKFLKENEITNSQLQYLKNYIGWIINAHKFSKKHNAKDLLIKDLIKMFSVVGLKNPCMKSCKDLYFCCLSKYHKGKCKDIMGLTWTKEETD